MVINIDNTFLKPLPLEKYQVNKLMFLLDYYFTNLLLMADEGNGYFALQEYNSTEVRHVHWLQLILSDIPRKILLEEKDYAVANRYPAHTRAMSMSDHPIDYTFSWWKREFGSGVVLPDNLDEKPVIIEGFRRLSEPVKQEDKGETVYN